MEKNPTGVYDGTGESDGFVPVIDNFFTNNYEDSMKPYAEMETIGTSKTGGTGSTGGSDTDLEGESHESGKATMIMRLEEMKEHSVAEIYQELERIMENHEIFEELCLEFSTASHELVIRMGKIMSEIHNKLVANEKQRELSMHVFNILPCVPQLIPISMKLGFHTNFEGFHTNTKNH